MYHGICRQWKHNVYTYGWLISVLLCETLGGIRRVKGLQFSKKEEITEVLIVYEVWVLKMLQVKQNYMLTKSQTIIFCHKEWCLYNIYKIDIYNI